MPQLLIHRRASFFQEYSFSNAGCVTIGRSRSNDLCLPDTDRRISRVHAAIVALAQDRECYFLRDLGSLRGVRVNGRSILQHLLGNGDVIELGDYEMIYSTVAPALERISPLRVVARRSEDESARLGTSSLTGWGIQREIEFSTVQKEVLESLLQATAQRPPGNELLREALPAIAGALGSIRSFAALFDANSPTGFEVLCRSGMGAGDQIETTEPDYATILVSGQPVLEERILLAPVTDRSQVIGFCGIEAAPGSRRFTADDATFVAMAARLAASRSSETTRRGLAQKAAPVLAWPTAMVGKSPAMEQLRNQVGEASASGANILIVGESGVGKELVAHAIHRVGGHASGPFLARNCATIPEGLAEAEIFGHAPRAGIAGADPAGASGWFEQAETGTLFLDEIHALTLPMQDKFLRVLQEREVWRIRARKPVPVRAQVIAATDHNLEEAARAGTFRTPLFFRFGMRLSVPPLRERKEDTALLAFYFLDRRAQSLDAQARTFSHRTLRLLQEYDWPGNVRELESAIAAAVASAGSRNVIFSWDLPASVTGHSAPVASSAPAASDPEWAAAGPGPRSVAVVEKEMILEALENTYGNITTAAKLLGYKSRQTMLNKMDRLGIARNYGDSQAGEHD